MGSKWVWLLMFVSLEWCLSQACLEEERVALLRLKPYFNDKQSLSDWVKGENNSDCCQWESIQCNNNTGKVIVLRLMHTRDEALGDWYLNMSLFSAFEELEFLGLDWNSIAGFVENEGLDKLSKLSNLNGLSLSLNNLKATVDLPALNSLQQLDFSSNEIERVVFPKGLDSLQQLDLSDNKIKKVIFLKGPGALSSLKVLDLRFNNLSGTINLQDPGVLPALQILDLGYNKLNGSVLLQGLNSHDNLQQLYLDSNEIEKIVFPKGLNSLQQLYLFNNKIEKVVFPKGALPSLKLLDLRENKLSGTIDLQGLNSCGNLQQLHLQQNEIETVVFPKGPGALSSLEELWLQNNKLNGTIDLQGLDSRCNLQHLDLSDNEIIGNIVFSKDLQNLNNLKILHLDNNNLSITFLQSTLPLLNSLEELTLSNCRLYDTPSYQDFGILTKLLYHLHNLQTLDLSRNNFTGEFPNWLFENYPKLLYLNLANNLLYGHIPKAIGEHVPGLINLNLSRNHFDGSIPSSIGDMKLLRVLDLSYNHLSGKIPDHLAKSCTSLQVLMLTNNNLQGQIFSSNFNLTSLAILQLDNNNFTGKIPDSLSNADRLSGLYLRNNNLSGRIPNWLGNMSALIDIIMPNNHLEGPIPSEFCQLTSLDNLNLEANNIYGTLPSCFSLPDLRLVHLSKNRLQGQLRDAFNVSSLQNNLLTLDLSHNQFHGIIPTSIGRISNLIYLILNNNNLVGELPTQLCQLKQLQLVDLSHNSLSGHIPYCLDVTSLHDNGSNINDILPDFYNVRIPGRLPESIAMRQEEIIEFTTKARSYSYRGKVLTYMCGIDLSCNKLIGSIPQQVGNLTRIHALNLSHNNLIGLIPQTFSMLKQIESLDLSYNNLNGQIPSQLVFLTTLSFFMVAHNNLSGKTPDRILQFSTFEENSYEGNPLLCGAPLNKSCDTNGPSSQMPGAPTNNGKDSDFIDMDIFYMSFMGSYVIVLLGIVAVLYINSYWRRTWFYLVETLMTSSYYFVIDNLHQRFHR